MDKNTGSVLITFLIIIIIFSISGLCLLRIINNNYYFMHNYKTRLIMFSVAESGIEDIAYRLKNDPLFRALDTETSPIINVNFIDYNYKVKTEITRNPDIIKIISSAENNSISSKVSREIYINFPLLYSIYSRNSIRLRKEVKVKGSIMSKGDIYLEAGSEIKGNIITGSIVSGRDYARGSIYENSLFYNYNKIDINNYSNNLIPYKNSSIEGLVLENQTLYLNDRTIIKNVTFKNVKIIAEDDIEFQGSINIISSKSKDIPFILAKGNIVLNNVSGKIESIIYSDKSISGSGSINIYGNITAHEVDLSGQIKISYNDKIIYNSPKYFSPEIILLKWSTG